MSQHFKASKISENTYWVGAIDWNLRDFHGYATHRGSTYNAYLITGEKNILIDTVKVNHRKEFLDRISSVIDLKDIDYIISNHSEMDHSGLLPEMIELTNPEKVFASVMGAKALSDHFGADFKVTPVKDNEVLELGNFHFRFVEARMLHWPDSMFTFFEEDGIFFSNDVFGMHLASSDRFDDDFGPCAEVLDYELAKYYANIIMPYAQFVLKGLDKLEELKLPIKLIATDHGPIWRGDLKKPFQLYREWSSQKCLKKAVVVYDTMWESTGKMARAVSEGLIAGGLRTKVMPLACSHRSDVATEILDAGALVIGSPILNGQIFPTVADVLTYLKGLKPMNLIGASIGSYGWKSDINTQLNKHLDEMGVKIVSEGVKAKYVPDSNDLKDCYDLGLEIAKQVREVCD